MKQIGCLLVLYICCISSAIAEPWPLSPTGSAHKIFAAYGQFAEDTGGSGFHFHEGIDIEAADGTNILAIAGGKVEELVPSGGAEKYSQFMTISVAGNVHVGWGYVHMRFGINPATGVTWAVGDAVSAGDVLGVVDKLDSGLIFSHLHLEYDNDTDGGWHPTGAGGVAALNGDPLEFVTPSTDTKIPTVTEIHYRDGDEEGIPTATYHTTKVDTKNVLYGNIDIVVRAEEQFTTGFSVPLSVQSIEFKVDGPTNITTQILEEFTGTFISSPNSFGKFRNADLTQVIYEIDDTVESNQDLLTGATNKFYYILTNKDDDNDLELTDSDRYWNTDINDNSTKWNTEDTTGASSNAAKHSLDSKFGDGLYKIAVVAKDEAGNTNTPYEQEIILDNWYPHVKKVEIGSPVKYSAEWQSIGTDADLKFIITKKEFLGTGAHPITIEFTEAVTESALPVLNIASFTTAFTLSSTEVVNKKKIWNGTLTLTTSDHTHDGEQKLSIEAKDLALNNLDGAPDSIAIRDNAGIFQDADNGGNIDTLHKINIDTQVPVVSLEVKTVL